ncbi:MAG: tRNA uridine-5-carboxymethylaminomethyl(34) synthesis GTPase MnmE [Oscillospiraceae bacterium]|nr:tRNA uridine-5-carboxymethylaminomethyl(34) synthesis GTPase MnmE [Oscillospiraceae bacterium]
MSDIIAAVSTGNQVCAIGIIRMTGQGCALVGDKVFTRSNGRSLADTKPRTLVMGQLHDAKGRVIDQCCAIVTPGPHSYTGEDTVEFHCHGSPAVLAAGLDALYRAGARPAKRGEFTKRAFLNGQMDLTSAEAVIDLIEAETAEAAANAAGQVAGRLQKKLAPIYHELKDLCSHFHAVLDYPDEDIDDFRLEEYASTLKQGGRQLSALMATYGQGQILRNGIRSAIVGKPNVGKSSLLNAIAGYDRVIVTEVAGTTRDTVEETVKLGSTVLRLIDTAGIRETDDRIEAMGVERSRAAVESADLAIVVIDGSQPLTKEDEEVIDLCMDRENVICLLNKSDLPQAVEPGDLPFMTIIDFCAKTGEGLDLLQDSVELMFEGETPCDGSILTNARQYDAIRRAGEAIDSALRGLRLGFTPDAVLTDVEIAMEAMGEVTGATVREDITNRIFERFCVGK